MKQKMKTCRVCAQFYTPKDIILKDPNDSVTIKRGLCEKDQARLDQGYIAVIGIRGKDVNIKPRMRTGCIAYMSKKDFKKLFNVPPPLRGITYCVQHILDGLSS